MTSLRTWMADLPFELADQPLRLLKIPGSHDSGGTPELDPKLPVADDLPDFIRRMGASPFVKAGVKRWGVTQNYSIRKQLEHGVRYLDLRVAYPPPKVRASEKDFRLVHGLFGMTLRHCLTQVADFLKENKKESLTLPDTRNVDAIGRWRTLGFFAASQKGFDQREDSLSYLRVGAVYLVVLLDVNHVYDVDETRFTTLAKEIVSILGESLLCPFIGDFGTITLNYMWTYGYRVIVFSPFKGRTLISTSSSGNATILLWPAFTIRSPWPNTSDMNVLIKALDQGLESRPEKSPQFFVSQGVLTPQYWDVVSNWFSTLKEFSKNTTPRVFRWINELSEEKRRKINIVILNFVEYDTSRFIITLNKILALKSTLVTLKAVLPANPADVWPRTGLTSEVAKVYAEPSNVSEQSKSRQPTFEATQPPAFQSAREMAEPADPVGFQSKTSTLSQVAKVTSEASEVDGRSENRPEPHEPTQPSALHRAQEIFKATSSEDIQSEVPNSAGVGKVFPGEPVQ